jgi:hypothetical protein
MPQISCRVSPIWLMIVLALMQSAYSDEPTGEEDPKVPPTIKLASASAPEPRPALKQPGHRR